MTDPGGSEGNQQSLLSVGDAARLAGLPVRAIHAAIQSGALPARQVESRSGWEYRVRLADLETYLGRSFAIATAREPAAASAGRLLWPAAGLLILALLAVISAEALPGLGRVATP